MGEHLRALELPGWNPNQFSGAPFIGDPQSGWMYVPAMVAFTVLPAATAYTWFLVFHLVLAGLSAYALGRVLGMGSAASLVAAAAFQLGPFVNHVSCCLIHVQLSAWIPLALIGVEMATRTHHWPSRLGWIGLTGLCVSQMVAGWIGQGAYNGLLVVGGFLLYRTLLSNRFGPGWKPPLSRLIVDGALILALGLGLSAAGLLPRLDQVGSTNLAGGQYSGYEINKYSSGLGIAEFLRLMMTTDNGWRSYLFYLGGATLALAIAAPILARRRFGVPFFLALTVVVSMLTFKGGPVLLLFSLLPRWFVLHEHVPTRVTAVQWLGPAMLAGAAVEAIRQGAPRNRLLSAAIAPMAGWAVALAGIGVAQGSVDALATIAVVSITCLAVAALVIVPHRWPGFAERRQSTLYRWVTAALLIAIIWDPAGRVFAGAVLRGEENPVLALPSGPVSDAVVAENTSKADPGGAGEFLQARLAAEQYVRFFGYDPTYYQSGWNWPSSYREFHWNQQVIDLLVTARAMRLDLFDLQGYNPVQLSNYVAFLNALNGQNQNYHDAQVLESGIRSPMLNLLNARYIVVPNQVPPGRPRADLLTLTATHPELFRSDTVRVLENAAALPRAWVVHEARRTTRDGTLWLLRTGTVDPRQTVVLPLNTTLPPLQQPADVVEEPVVITHYEPDRITLQATLAADGIVVVSEVWDRGWNAYVDGERVPLYLADGLLRAAGVPAGTHTLELRYEPLALRAGIAISIASLLAMLGIAAVAALSFGRRRMGTA
jgi:hypothetical protein